jgi:hypothetical protein
MKRFAPLLLIGLLFLGCQKARPTLPEAVSVSGKLLDAKGKPIANKIVIVFHATDVNYTQDIKPTTPAKDEGLFTMKLRPGSYKVTLANIPIISGGAPGAGGPAAGPAQEKGAPAAALYPAEYGNEGTTPWKIEVKPGTNEPFTLQIGK